MDSIPEKYVFPPELCVTSLGPDLLVYSLNLKGVLLVELTGQHLNKENRYYGLVSDLRAASFQVYLFAVEMGAGGLPAKSVRNLFKELALLRKAISTYLNRLTKAVLQAFFYIRLMRDRPWVEGEGRVGRP